MRTIKLYLKADRAEALLRTRALKRYYERGDRAQGRYYERADRAQGRYYERGDRLSPISDRPFPSWVVKPDRAIRGQPPPTDLSYEPRTAKAAQLRTRRPKK
jgi:hypothetical protein